MNDGTDSYIVHATIAKDLSGTLEIHANVTQLSGSDGPPGKKLKINDIPNWCK